MSFNRNLGMKSYRFWTVGSTPRFARQLLLRRQRHPQLWQGAYGLVFGIAVMIGGGLEEGGGGGVSSGLRGMVVGGWWWTRAGCEAPSEPKSRDWQRVEGWLWRREKTTRLVRRRRAVISDGGEPLETREMVGRGHSAPQPWGRPRQGR